MCVGGWVGGCVRVWVGVGVGVGGGGGGGGGGVGGLDVVIHHMITFAALTVDWIYCDPLARYHIQHNNGNNKIRIKNLNLLKLWHPMTPWDVGHDKSVWV